MPDTMKAMPKKRTKAEILAEIKYCAESIVEHRNDPCDYWKGHGCEVSMAHFGDDILALLSELGVK